MKRVSFVILLALLIGIAMNQPASASGTDDFDIKKGKVIDFNRDGIWDFAYFTLNQSDPSLDLPVTGINIFNSQKECVVPDFYGFRLNKEKTLYVVSLRGLNLSGPFSMETTIDTSALSLDDGGSQVEIGNQISAAGGPGNKPKETILIIEYP